MFSSAPTTIRVKAKFGQNARRFQVNANQSFLQFMSQVESIFQKVFTLDQVVFRYMDDEKDIIDMETEDEYKEAVRLALKAKDTLLYLIIDKKGESVSQVNVMREVQSFLNKSFEDTNKFVNQENLSQLYATVVEKLDGVDAQKKFTEIIGQFGTYLNQLGTSTSFQVKQQVKPEEKQEPKGVIPCARFVKDVTLEDGAEIEAGSDFVKVWRVKNTGKQTWAEGTSLLFLGGGDGMPVGAKYSVPLAKPDEEVDISVQLKCNTLDSTLKGAFRLVTKEGEEFGNKLMLFLHVIKKKELVKEPIIQIKPKFDKSKWTSQLVFLRDMGFSDEDVNVSLLEQHKGDLTAVVQKILGN
jgi:hypothetical protein